MSGGRHRWLGLGFAVAAVAAVPWILQAPRPSRSRTSPQADDASAGLSSPGGRARAVDRARGGRGLTRRETTVAGHGRVRAQVVDEDGAAVTEGRVVLWCLAADGTVDRIRDGAATLDDDGRFEGPGCRGQVCPELLHPFRVPAQPWILRPGTEPVLEARALPRLWGRVVDPDGTSVAAAQITVTAAPDQADDPTAVLPVVSARTSTDGRGEFSLARIERAPCDPCQQARQACPDGPLPVFDRIQLVARAPGWAPGSRIVASEDGDDPDEPVVVTLVAARAAISGTLVDAQGRALAGASVVARSKQRPAEQHQVDASEGIFSFDALGEGPYTVRAIRHGKELLRRPGVEPGQTLTLRLSQATRDVELRVVDEHGRPYAGVRIDGGPFEDLTTDPDGLVRAQRVVPGSYILRVRPPGARAQAHQLEVPALASESPGARNPSPLRIEVASAD
ncbi:MAG: carboxypeptidase-like regulatory domain-containing protein [Myxococcota bacterium]